MPITSPHHRPGTEETRQISRRVAALEAARPQALEFGITGAWIVADGQTADDALAAYVAEHGEVDPERTVIWTIIDSPGPLSR